MLPRTRREGLHRNELDGQVVLYDEQSDQVHLLDPTTAAVYDLLEGNRSIDEVTGLLSERLRIPADTALVELALDELDKVGLLVENEKPGESRDVSRREVIRKLGLTGAFAVLVPAILTVATPATATAGSVCSKEGGTCDDEIFCCPGFVCNQSDSTTGTCSAA